MELNRLTRVIRERWLVLVLIGLIGVAAAVSFTEIANNSDRTRFEATAPIRFVPEEGETIADLGDLIDEAESVAIIAAGELLIEDTTSLILADPGSAQLLFIATGRSPDEAGKKANAMRQAYFEIDPTVGGSVDDLLDQVELQAITLETQASEFHRELTPEDLDLIFEHEVVTAKIGAVNARIVELIVADAAADPEQRAANNQERAQLEQTLISLQQDADSLAPIPEVEQLTVQEQFQLKALETRLELLALEYERLFLRKLGVTGLGVSQAITLMDLTPLPGSRVVNAGIGLVGGLLAGIFALILITRFRKPVWLPEDLSIPVLGEIPGRRVTSGTEPWYDTDAGSPRKSAIQQLRSVVEAHLPASRAALAIASHNVNDENAHALALDLATSMASAGSSVLIVDADFESNFALGEYRAGGPSLSGVLGLNPASMGFESSVESVVDGAYLIRSGLAVVPAGPRPSSPADALAGRQFRAFIDKSVEQFDMVIVAVGDMTSPSAQVAMQRLRRTLLVLTPGRSTTPEVNGLVAGFARAQVSLLGAVFLQRREGPVYRQDVRAVVAPVPLLDQSPEPGVEPESPLERLSHYPLGNGQEAPPVETAPPPAASLAAASLPVAIPEMAVQEESGLGSDLIDALDLAGSDGGYDAVADYLVTRVEDIIAVGSVNGGDSPDGLALPVYEDGFVSLRPLGNRPTVGKLIESDIRREVKPQAAMAVVDEMERLLATKSGRAVYLDDWLADQFFKLHIVRSGGQPFIWHITSSDGTVQLLVPAHRFDRELIQRLMSDVAVGTIEELRRYENAATTRGDLEQAETFAIRTEEVKQFGAALERLVGIVFESSTGGGRSGSHVADSGPDWWPDLSAGTRENLAPLQRVGLLPFGVLNDEEMSSVLAGK